MVFGSGGGGHGSGIVLHGYAIGGSGACVGKCGNVAELPSSVNEVILMLVDRPNGSSTSSGGRVRSVVRGRSAFRRITTVLSSGFSKITAGTPARDPGICLEGKFCQFEWTEVGESNYLVSLKW